MIECQYGCKKEAKFQLKNSKWCCEKSPNKCPEIKRRNSESVRLAHKENRVFGWGALVEKGKVNRGWAKGLTKDTDKRIKPNSLKGKIKGHPQTELTKKKISLGRIKNLLDNKKDVSGKGRRGFYDGIFFHSSWELSYYIYQKEVNNILVKKNNKVMFKYEFDGKTFNYIPDFINGSEIIEIKAYLYSLKDKAKYEQTKDKVKYLFLKDLKDCLKYCTEKYGDVCRLYNQK